MFFCIRFRSNRRLKEESCPQSSFFLQHAWQSVKSDYRRNNWGSQLPKVAVFSVDGEILKLWPSWIQICEGW